MNAKGTPIKTWAEKWRDGEMPKPKGAPRKHATPEESKAAKDEAAKRWREANPEKVRAYKLKYSRSKKGKAKKREYYEANREKALESARKWKDAHREEVRAMAADYRVRNAAKIKRRKLEKRREQGAEVEAEQKRRSAERQLEKLLRDPEDPRHGTVTGYNYGCRCERCLEGGRAYFRNRKR